MSGYRSGSYTPIRPAAPASPAGGGPPDPNEPGPVSNRRSLPRRQVTPVACSACKKRKSKCDGARPTCTTCQNRQTECVFDASADQRRTAALKEKLGGLREENSALKEIIQLMNTPEAQQRYGSLMGCLYQSEWPEAEAVRVVELIRTGGDPTMYIMERQSEGATTVGGGMEGLEQHSAHEHPWQHLVRAAATSPSPYDQDPSAVRGEGPYGEGPSSMQRGHSSNGFGPRHQYDPSSSDHIG